MASPIPLIMSYSGICRDLPRDQLPAGYLWECIDWIPQILKAPLAKRGGWTFASRTLGATSSVKGLVYAPFASGALNLAVTSDNHLYKFTTGSETDLGAAVDVSQNPVFHRSLTTALGGLVIVPAAGGATTPKSYDGTTLQNLAGTPPQATYAAVWNDYLMLANGTVSSVSYPNRVWFSKLGDPAATWDTTNTIWDASLPIVGVAALRASVLLFHARSTERLRGTTPPTSTNAGGDLAMDSAFDVGCMDARTVVRWNDWVIWADARGVYMSDGTTLKNLTATGLIQSFWQLWAAVTHDCVAAGVINDHYIVSLSNGGSELATFAYNLNHGFWFRVSNFPFRCYARSGAQAEETYAGMPSQGRVVALSQIFFPSGANKNDADGTAVVPYMETGLFRGFMRLHRRWIPSMAIQNWRAMWMNYVLADAANDLPTLTVGWIIDHDIAFTNTLPVLTNTSVPLARVRRDLRFTGHAIAFQVAQGGPSANSELYAIEAWYEPLETGRLNQ